MYNGVVVKRLLSLRPLPRNPRRSYSNTAAPCRGEYRAPLPRCADCISALSAVVFVCTYRFLSLSAPPVFYCYQYITVVQFVARVGTLTGENRYGFAGENWYTLFYCLQFSWKYVTIIFILSCNYVTLYRYFFGISLHFLDYSYVFCYTIM